METTLFLAKLVGIALVVIGVVIAVRRRDLVPVFAGYVDQPLLRVTISMIELLAGLGLVVHNAWSPLPAAVMTSLGWMAVAEAVFYMAAPNSLVAQLMDTFNTETWYVVGGGLAVAVGLYLAGFGFGGW
jgi:uncharacterized membrane protein